MNTRDSTASQRMAKWRQRMKAEGWKSYNVWLPADKACVLDDLVAESDTNQRETLTRTLVAGIHDGAVDDDAEQTIANLKADVDHWRRQAQGALTEEDCKLINDAVQYLDKGRDKAQRNTARKLRALLERLEP